jgi:hypothetical protein
MFRATGQGKVDERFSTPSFLHAVLYNFDFDDFIGLQYRPLKQEHRAYLQQHVVPMLDDDQGAVWMQGSASRIGTNDWNMTTSRARVSRVAAFLAEHGIAGEQMQLDAIGEENAATHAEDDERDRSVRLWVAPKFHYVPEPIPQRVPSKPLTSRHFKIAMLVSFSVSTSSVIKKFLSKMKFIRFVMAEVAAFIIWDTTNNISCLYLYVGIGPGIGIDLSSVSGTTHGPWNAFTTEKPMAVWQFGRWARFTTAGGGSLSVNWLTVETPPGIDNVYLMIDTGTTLGVAASTSVGDLYRIEQPHRFYGP